MFWASGLSSGKEREVSQEMTCEICFQVPDISMLMVLAGSCTPACLSLGVKAMKLSHILMRSCWHPAVFFIFGKGRGRVESSRGGRVR